MKSLDKILKELMESKSLALADELLKNYNFENFNKGAKMLKDKLAKGSAIAFNTLDKSSVTQDKINQGLKISVDKQSHHKILDEWAEKEWGEKENKTPAPQNQGGQEIIVSDNYTINPQNVAKNKQNSPHKKEKWQELLSSGELSEQKLSELSPQELDAMGRELKRAYDERRAQEKRACEITNLIELNKIMNDSKNTSAKQILSIFETQATDDELARKIDFIKPFNDKPFFIKGAVQMIAANPSAGKTTFISDICAELVAKGEFSEVIHIDPENILNAYETRNQNKIIELTKARKWHFIEPSRFNEKSYLKGINGFLELFYNKDLGSTLIFIDSYGAMIDRNDNAPVTEFLMNCQRLSNKTGATIIITSHNNKGGLIYTGGASNQQYVSLFYQLHTISQANSTKALLLECTKARYGVMDSFTQGYELDFSVECGKNERYTKIPDDELAELIKRAKDTATNARSGVESQEAKAIEIIEQIHAILLSGAKTATQIAKTLGKPNNYAQRVLKPILEKWQGVRWIVKKRQDATGRMCDYYELPQSEQEQQLL